MNEPNPQLTISRIIEAVLFAADAPVDPNRLVDIAGELSGPRELADVVSQLNTEYENAGRAFRINQVAGGYQFETLPCFGVHVERLYQGRLRPRLSRAALETLAVVAYKQPIAKSEIDALRGVDSDASLRTLQNRELIEVTSRAETQGKPLRYGTTQEFLRYFGLRDMRDLPGADELASMFDGTEPEPQAPGQLSLGEAMNQEPSGSGSEMP